MEEMGPLVGWIQLREWLLKIWILSYSLFTQIQPGDANFKRTLQLLLVSFFFLFIYRDHHN